MQQFTVPLSRLLPSKHNPRRVKPAREAHHRLVALIRAHGLMHPLIVRPCEGKRNRFLVIAGNRRLAALQEIHRNDGDPRIACVLRKIDERAAEALSLGENFGREAMHPLDEAEAFAKLATHDGKDAQVVAAEFGVSEHYVKQRLSLSNLATPIKAAYRQSLLDTATAEAFASVPAARQLEVWQEVGEQPRHAQHVRNIIANRWIDASLAMFPIDTIPQSSVSQDLFSEKTLIERQAFMEAQSQAILAQQEKLKEEGWAHVIVGRREDVFDKLLSMEVAPPKFDKQNSATLKKLDQEVKQLQSKIEKSSADEPANAELVGLVERLDEEAELLRVTAAVYPEKTKAVGSVFLMLDPDGQVHREYRVPRRQEREGSGGADTAGVDGATPEPEAPTSDQLSDRQLTTTYVHLAIGVRRALMKDRNARRRTLALALHESIRSEALAIRHDANGVTLHASANEDFRSKPLDQLRSTRKAADPFFGKQHVDDVAAYAALRKLSGAKVDALIDVLVIDMLTAHMQRGTPLIEQLAHELNVNIRDFWRPDAAWLSAFTKYQLSHLIVQLRGTIHQPAPERKKTELVQELDKLFRDAVEGKLEDKALAEELNRWLPANLRTAAK